LPSGSFAITSVQKSGIRGQIGSFAITSVQTHSCGVARAVSGQRGSASSPLADCRSGEERAVLAADRARFSGDRESEWRHDLQLRSTRGGRRSELSVERDNDLAVGAALLDIGQRLEGLAKWEGRVDDRAEVSGVVKGGQLAQLGAVGLHEQERVAHP
jgi:hypothetical protein